MVNKSTLFNFYFFRMEHEPFGGLAVEAVADDGIAQAEGMGAVDTELMRAARYRSQLNEGMTVPVLNHAVMRLGLLAVLSVHHLARPVIEVGPQG